MWVTKEFLEEKPNYIFVFGDNNLRYGKGGAAKLRDLPNTFGFITKKAPSNNDESFYRPEEYKLIFENELKNLIKLIELYTHNIFLISKLGSGLANKYNIYEEVIKQGLQKLTKYNNVKFI